MIYFLFYFFYNTLTSPQLDWIQCFKVTAYFYVHEKLTNLIDGWRLQGWLGLVALD